MLVQAVNHPETGQHLPLVPPVSQFDGGPKASQNCMAASIARLRRFLTGVPTTGTQVRSHQSDQVGGISIPDGLCALRRMAPVVRPNWAAPFDSSAKPDPINHIGGTITEAALIHLLEEGNMVVVAGDYGDLPVEWREQKSFRDDHAMTFDAVFGVSSTRAAYVVDTIPKPGSGYQGRVIPWKALMAYAHGLAGPGRIYATWGKPPKPPKPTPPPDNAEYTMKFAPHADLRIYDLTPRKGQNACIKSWTDEEWGDTASSAPCEAPIHLDTCDGKSGATKAKVLAGRYAGKHLRVGNGTSVVPR